MPRYWTHDTSRLTSRLFAFPHFPLHRHLREHLQHTSRILATQALRQLSTGPQSVWYSHGCPHFHSPHRDSAIPLTPRPRVIKHQAPQFQSCCSQPHYLFKAFLVFYHLAIMLDTLAGGSQGNPAWVDSSPEGRISKECSRTIDQRRHTPSL